MLLCETCEMFRQRSTQASQLPCLHVVSILRAVGVIFTGCRKRLPNLVNASWLGNLSQNITTFLNEK